KYDANGQLSERNGGSAATTYEYDLDENLTRIVYADGSVTTFGYDAFSRRVYKSHNGDTTRYAWSGHQMLAEQAPDKTVIEYLVIRFQPLAQFVGGSWYSIITNHISMPCELIDSSGEVCRKGYFNALGQLERETGAGPRCPFRLPGQYADRETGLHYN